MARRQTILLLMDHAEAEYSHCREQIINDLQCNEDDTSMWNRELCGKIIGHTKNGHSTFCNIHKYQHYHEQSHEFVTKDQDMLDNEFIQNRHIRIYQERLNELANKLYQTVETTLLNGYTYTKVDLNSIDQINQYLRNHPQAFKENKIDGNSQITLYHSANDRLILQ